MAFWNASRSVVLVVKDKHDPDVYRLVVHKKANNSRLAPPERWRVEEVEAGVDARTGVPVRVPRMVFVEIADDVEADDVLAPRTITKTATAESWLSMALSDGEWHPVAPLKEMAKAARFSERTVDRAADELGVEKTKTDEFPSRSLWRLLTHSPAAHSPTLPHKSGECGDSAQPSGFQPSHSPTSGDMA
jgi:hypothetical protein